MEADAKYRIIKKACEAYKFSDKLNMQPGAQCQNKCH